MRVILILLSIFIASYVCAQDPHVYQNQSAGIAFNYDNVSIDKNSGKDVPLSVVFAAGSRPFAVSVLFKEEKGSGTLGEFIENERENQRQGGYEKEVTITKISNSNIAAYEIIRKSNSIKIRWFVFSSQKNNNLYSFWLAENSSLKKENPQAIKAYKTMKSTLVLFE